MDTNYKFTNFRNLSSGQLEERIKHCQVINGGATAQEEDEDEGPEIAVSGDTIWFAKQLSQNGRKASRDLNQRAAFNMTSGNTFGMQPFCWFPWRPVRSITPFGIPTLGSYWSG